MFGKNKERVKTLEHNLEYCQQAYDRLYGKVFAYVIEANRSHPDELRLYSHFLDMAQELGVDPRSIRLDVVKATKE